jgi:thiamine monophosphate kinase
VLALWPKDVLALCLWLGLDPLEIALQGGEDYLLLATGASRRRPAFAYCIGQVAAEPATGVRVLLPGGQTRALSRAGFDHLGH